MLWLWIGLALMGGFGLGFYAAIWSMAHMMKRGDIAWTKQYWDKKNGR